MRVMPVKSSKTFDMSIRTQSLEVLGSRNYRQVELNRPQKEDCDSWRENYFHLQRR